MTDGSFEPLTVLEAVVKQTGVYAPSRLGRLSVYWGDQVFVPNVAFKYTPTHHVDIMCTDSDYDNEQHIYPRMIESSNYQVIDSLSYTAIHHHYRRE